MGPGILISPLGPGQGRLSLLNKYLAGDCLGEWCSFPISPQTEDLSGPLAWRHTWNARTSGEKEDRQ